MNHSYDTDISNNIGAVHASDLHLIIRRPYDDVALCCASKALLIKQKYLTLSCSYYLGIFMKLMLLFSREKKITRIRSVDHKNPLFVVK